MELKIRFDKKEDLQEFWEKNQFLFNKLGVTIIQEYKKI